MADQIVPAARRRAETEAANVRIVQPALVEVVEHLRTLVRPQHRMKIAGGNYVCFVNALSLLGVDGRRFFLCAELRERHVRALREMPDRLLKLHPLHFHHKVDDCAALVTAEAVVQLRFGVHGEGGRLFIVKRTAAPEPPALLFQRNIFRHDFLQADPRTQLIQKCI